MSKDEEEPRETEDSMGNVIIFAGGRRENRAEAPTVQASPLVLWVRRAARRSWRGARLFMEAIGWIVFGASIMAAVIK